MKKEELFMVQKNIGYDFKNEDLLLQAFTRKSYSAENGGADNEVLEFIGDKALDVVIVKYLTERYGYMSEDYDDFNSEEEYNEFFSEKSEGQLTSIKGRLVCKNTLASRMERLKFAPYMRMGEGDIKNNVYESDSVKEDLFEAIIGAVAIDSGWNFEQIESSVMLLLDPDELLEKDESENYVNFIYEWTMKEHNKCPAIQYQEGSYELSLYTGIGCIDERIGLNSDKIRRIKYHCYLRISDDLLFRGFGESKAEARKGACKRAYEYLEDNDMLFSIRDEIENPNKDDAVNQLETLARRGYFSIPEYVFEEDHDGDGNPVWLCECHIDEYEEYCDATSSSKKDAKKTAAFDMLKYVLE